MLSRRQFVKATGAGLMVPAVALARHRGGAASGGGGGGLTITTSSLSNGTQGLPYSAAINATGGTAPYSWRLLSGSLNPYGGSGFGFTIDQPALSLNYTGALNGLPLPNAETDTFTVQVTDSVGATASQSLSLTTSAASPGYTLTGQYANQLVDTNPVSGQDRYGVFNNQWGRTLTNEFLTGYNERFWLAYLPSPYSAGSIQGYPFVGRGWYQSTGFINSSCSAPGSASLIQISALTNCTARWVWDQPVYRQSYDGWALCDLYICPTSNPASGSSNAIFNLLIEPFAVDTSGNIQYNVIKSGAPYSPVYSPSYGEFDGKMWFYQIVNSSFVSGSGYNTMSMWPAPWNDAQNMGAHYLTLNLKQLLTDILAASANGTLVNLSGTPVTVPFTTSSYLAGFASGWETNAAGPSYAISGITNAAQAVVSFSTGVSSSVTAIANQTSAQYCDTSGFSWAQVTYNFSGTVNGASVNPFTVGQFLQIHGAGGTTGINDIPLWCTNTAGTSGAYTIGLNHQVSDYGSAYTSGGTIDIANPFRVGRRVVIEGVSGMTQINGLIGTVVAVGGVAGAYTVTLNINSTGFSTYTSGGVVDTRVFQTLDFQCSMQSEPAIQINTVPEICQLWSRHLPSAAIDSSPAKASSLALTADYQNNYYQSGGSAPSGGSPQGIAIDISSVSSALKSATSINIISGGYRIYFYQAGPANGASGSTGAIGTFTVEANTAAFSAGVPPSTGWVTLKTVTNCVVSTKLLNLGNLSSYNSLRVKCTAPAPNAYGSGSSGTQLHVDVYYAPTQSNPNVDGILMMGDSITAKTFYPGFGEDGGAADYLGNTISLYTGHTPPVACGAISGWALAPIAAGTAAYPPFLPWLQGIYGPVTFTAPLASGASSGTLATPWANPTGIYALNLDNNQQVLVTLTNGSASTGTFMQINETNTTISSNCSTAVATMNQWIDDWAGRYVYIALGTNDSASGVTQSQFQSALVWVANRCIALGKTLILPHVFFNAGSSTWFSSSYPPSANVFSGYIDNIVQLQLSSLVGTAGTLSTVCTSHPLVAGQTVVFANGTRATVSALGGSSGAWTFTSSVAGGGAYVTRDNVIAGPDLLTIGFEMMKKIYDPPGSGTPEAGGLHPGVLGQPMFRGIVAQWLAEVIYLGKPAAQFEPVFNTGYGITGSY